MPDPVVTLALGTALLFALILLHVPVGAAMALTGLIGFGLISGPGPAFSTIAIETTTALSSLDLTTIPLFLLMGSLATRAGLATDIYDLSSAVVGRFRGGLAVATVMGCAGFGALCGSSLATTATMARVALPEMTRRGYAPELATGSIAGGGSLAILIPPSIVMIVYAVLTEQFVLDLFLAGILPGLLSVVLYGIAITVVTWFRPEFGPAFEGPSRREVLAAALRAWRAVVVVILVVGGIYAGVVTVTEAASFGVVVTLGFFLARVRGRWASEAREAFAETARTTGLIFLMIIGASIFSYFLTISGATGQIVSAIAAMPVSDYTILLAILFMYLILGAVFDTIAAMVLTLPFVFPIVLEMGFDPIWWGVVNVMIIEIGLITPPIGLNVFVMKGMAPQVPLGTIFRGILPFFTADIARIGLILAFPQIALVLIR